MDVPLPYCELLDLKMNKFKKPFKISSRPAKAPGAPPESALSRACGAGDLEAIKLILNTVPTSHAAKIDAIFAGNDRSCIFHNRPKQNNRLW